MRKLNPRWMRYSRSGQLVFDCERLENFLLTRDRLVGNKITITKCQIWVSHMQILCTIALVSDAQVEGKCPLRLNHDCHTIIGNIVKHLRGICRARLWSAIARGTKEYKWPTNWWIIIYQWMDNFNQLMEYWLKSVLIRYLVNSMQNQAQWTNLHSAIGHRSIAIDLLAPPWSIPTGSISRAAHGTDLSPAWIYVSLLSKHA